MRTAFLAALAFFAAAIPMGSTVGQTPNLEQKIWTLLDNEQGALCRAVGARLPRARRGLRSARRRKRGHRARGEGARRRVRSARSFARSRRNSSAIAPTGSSSASAATISIGTSARCRLTSNNPEAKNYPWFIIMNGGAANLYEFYVDLKNRPGWTQFLAQKLNVMIVTHPRQLQIRRLGAAGDRSAPPAGVSARPRAAARRNPKSATRSTPTA